MKALTLFKTSCSIFLLCLSTSGWAEVKIIAHPGIKASGITVDDIAEIYLGETSALPGGIKAIPYDQSEDQSVRSEFYLKAAKKDNAQLKAHWSRLIFTGKGKPPQVLYDSDETIATVKSTPGAIGYVSGNTNTQGVTVLLVIP